MKTLGSRTVKWVREQVYEFIAEADARGETGIANASMIAFELRQRQGDVVNFGKEHYNGHKMKVRQNKTNARVWVPLDALPEMRRRVSAALKKGTTIVQQPNGKPWKENMHRFRKVFVEIRKDLNLPEELTFEDFRRSRLTELANAGAATDELRSVSGIKTREILNAYVVPSTEQAGMPCASASGTSGADENRRA